MLRAPRRETAFRDTELTRVAAVLAPVLSHLDPKPHGDDFATTGVPTNAALGCPVHVLAEAVPAAARNTHVLIMIDATPNKSSYWRMKYN